MNSISRIVCLAFVFSLIFLTQSQATHNRAGEITYVQTGALTFEVTITTYTKASSIPADRDSLELCWGDGFCEFIARTNGNGNGVNIGNDIKVNEYVSTHTYPGRSTYTVSMTDPNRNGGILNVNPPQSDQVPFHLETTICIANQQFVGLNTSPILLQEPIDVGYVNQTFVHNPNATDLEGDSLAYELIVPLQGVGVPVTNYSFPNAIGPQPQSLSVNPTTGQLTWISPQVPGEYNVAILIKEYRRGHPDPLTTMIRDMQITIYPDNNRPPTIEPIPDICVIAGETIQFTVKGDDPDAGDQVRLTATGGPLLPASVFDFPASFTAPAGYTNPIVTGTFTWDTRCEHIQDQPYQLVFKAEDDFEGTFGASTFIVVRIKVVGPPPEDVQAEVVSGEVVVSWEEPYVCDQAPEFRGFQVWRREGSNPFVPDSCETGLGGRGYTRIASLVDTVINNRYTYVDTDVERGRFYCYRILAEFAEINPVGNPFNFVESIPSDEICVQMSRDLPLITNVSVESTDIASGSIEVKWSKPSAEDLDTLQNPGPYEYRVMRSPDFTGTNLTQVASFVSNSFAQANDTIFLDTNFDTETQEYSYRIDFYNNGTLVGSTRVASSVFLSIASTDQTNILTWREVVPWENFEYTVYRQNDITGVFDSVGITSSNEYRDTGLENEKEYCYLIRSVGSYNIPGIIDPIVNFSQEACGIPIDTVPPCPPSLIVSNLCLDASSPAGVFENYLLWTNPNNVCVDDAVSYDIYYAETESADFNIIETITFIDDTTYLHQLGNTVAGCYYVTATDSLGNESAPSNIICVDNCPNYNLPNVFTPNNDGVNDLYHPFPYQFIDRINIKIFNRWGGLVFQGTDPDINWNGTNLQGQALADGVYHYVCEVFEVRVDGVVRNPQVLTGYIHLINGN